NFVISHNAAISVATLATLQVAPVRFLGVPLTTADRLSKAIGMAKTIQEAIAGNPEIQDLQNQDPAVRHLLAMAGKLQGLARHLGTHAAAVVISQGPLVETAPLQRTPDGGAQTQWEYPMAEAAGLVKMDFLGLRTLTVLKDALTYIEQHHGVTYDLPTLPLDNARAYELMARGDTAGVFQLESVGMRNALRQLKPDRISDVIAMVALYRPGPMAEIPKFCLGKHDPGTITYLHPALEPILRETYGVLVYQEQVMAIGREVAGLNPADANDLLNALRKKNLDKMAKLEPVFLTGVKTTSGFTDTQAEALWDRLKEFAKYAFNKAHSACYALVAYQTAFLKANYPVEFMTALLTSVMDSQDKVSLYVAECRKLGIEVLAPDVNFSRVGFTVEDGGIRFGLTAIKGVGTGVVEAIVASREADGPFSDLFDFCARVGGTLCNRAALESLIKSGAMDGLPGNRAQKLALADAAVDMGQSAARDRAVGQVNLFGDMAATVQTIVPDLPPLPEFSAQELLTMERDFLGLYVSDHPIHAHEEALLEFRTASVEELAEARAGDEVVIGGMLTVVKPHVSKNGKQMAFLTLDDLTGAVEITVFAEPYEKARAFLKQDAIVLVKGTVDFGTFQRTPTTDDEEEEKPDPKLLAIAIAPIDDEAAIQELQRAAARRRGNGYGNGNGRHGGTSAAVTALPVYKPERPVHQGDGMTGAPNGNGKATRPCRICLSEAFVTSDDFATLPALLCSCRGDAPVEITVILANGARRRWRVPTITVNPDCVSKHLRILPGVSVAE
ncbi:MAG TPA: DNA polymerase III subunit alpha, partial [Armatimonadota bacterium]|nr:DNA polymerase III subunit alpha [Armatimonadota bacterium]